MRKITARPYQQEAVDEVFKAHYAGSPGALVRLPTGCGKTITAGLAARRWLSEGVRRKVFILCHETQLVHQFAREMKDVLQTDVAIEQGANRVSSRHVPDVVVASRASLAEKYRVDEMGFKERISRLNKFDPSDDWLVIVDEAHRYSRKLKLCGPVFEHFEGNQNSFRLGITATPWRTDGISLESLFPTIACDLQLIDLDGGPSAVNDGWCVPYVNKYVMVQGVDFGRDIKTTGGDFDEESLAEILAGAKVLSSLVDPTLDIVGERRTLVFCATIEMSKKVAEYINQRSGKVVAKSLDGSVPHLKREEVYRSHKRGDFQFLCVCGLCLARGTSILTDHGEIPIENVTPDMKVWDGVEFVKHDGVVSRGVRPVITYAGLTATEDHNVWSGGQWKSLAECAKEGLAISVAGDYGVPVKESEGLVRSGGAEGRNSKGRGRVRQVRISSVEELLPSHERNMFVPTVHVEGKKPIRPKEEGRVRLRGDWECRTRTIVGDRGSTEADRAIKAIDGQGEVYRLRTGIRKGSVGDTARRGWMQELLKEFWNAELAVDEVPRCEEEMLQSERSILPGLRRAGDRVPLQLANGNGEVDLREFGSSQRAFPGQDRQQRPLQAREFEVCNHGGAGQQQEKEEGVEIVSRETIRLEEVFDIVNAGPRHRFTAEGLIVSNCREGYDDPGIQAVAIFRPTKSTSLAEQMKGRGCRPLRGTVDGLATKEERLEAIANSPKKNCLIVDLVGVTGLAGAASAARCYAEGQPDEVVERAEAIMIKGQTDLKKAMDQAKEEVAKEAAEARRLKEDEERRLEVARVAMLEARARYKVSGAAPGMMTSMLDTQDYPTEKQIRYLKWIRLSFNEKLMTKQQASKLISMHKFSSSLTKIQNEVDKWELKRLKKL